jgi:hypothetical protein
MLYAEGLPAHLGELRDDLTVEAFTDSFDTLWYRDEAVTRFGCDDLEIDDHAIVSQGDDPGAFVHTWTWVEGLPPARCSEEGCAARGEDEGVESTPCGSFFEDHLWEHVVDCEVCANEFPDLVETIIEDDLIG